MAVLQAHGGSQPAALPGYQGQSDGESGERRAQLKRRVVWDLHGVTTCLFWLQTGVWTELYKIEDSFMKPLRVGLNMSRAHYEQELRSCSERRRNKGQACPTGLL